MRQEKRLLSNPFIFQLSSQQGNHCGVHRSNRQSNRSRFQRGNLLTSHSCSRQAFLPSSPVNIHLSCRRNSRKRILLVNQQNNLLIYRLDSQILFRLVSHHYIHRHSQHRNQLFYRAVSLHNNLLQSLPSNQPWIPSVYRLRNPVNFPPCSLRIIPQFNPTCHLLDSLFRFRRCSHLRDPPEVQVSSPLDNQCASRLVNLLGNQLHSLTISQVGSR